MPENQAPRFFTRDRNAKEIEAGLIVEVGAHTYGQFSIYAPPKGENGRLFIGDYTSIARNVKVMLGGNHRTDWVSTYPFAQFPRYKKAFRTPHHTTTKGDVVIGSDVWIGQDATIMSGVTVGHGAVIGAGALVTKDIAPYMIAGGNPAKVIRSRFPPDAIENLLRIEWWTWPEEEIFTIAHLLTSNDINAIIIYAAGRAEHIPAAAPPNIRL